MIAVLGGSKGRFKRSFQRSVRCKLSLTLLSVISSDHERPDQSTTRYRIWKLSASLIVDCLGLIGGDRLPDKCGTHTSICDWPEELTPSDRVTEPLTVLHWSFSRMSTAANYQLATAPYRTGLTDLLHLQVGPNTRLSRRL